VTYFNVLSLRLTGKETAMT